MKTSPTTSSTLARLYWWHLLPLLSSLLLEEQYKLPNKLSRMAHRNGWRTLTSVIGITEYEKWTDSNWKSTKFSYKTTMHQLHQVIQMFNHFKVYWLGRHIQRSVLRVVLSLAGVLQQIVAQYIEVLSFKLGNGLSAKHKQFVFTFTRRQNWILFIAHCLLD